MSNTKEPPPENTAIDFAADAGAGLSNVTQNDLGIPFLNILQKMSPELDRQSADYNPEAREGDIISNVTKQKIGGFNEPFECVPMAYIRSWVEWKPRESGGGMIARHRTDAILRGSHKNEKGKDVLPNGNIIETTATFAVQAKVNGRWQPFIIAMTSTGLTVAKQWLNLATNIHVKAKDGSLVTPPLFSHRYNLSTRGNSNAQGSWMGWKVELAGPVLTVEDYQKFRAGCESATQFLALPAPGVE